jgi:hypothetical protein
MIQFLSAFMEFSASAALASGPIDMNRRGHLGTADLLAEGIDAVAQRFEAPGEFIARPGGAAPASLSPRARVSATVADAPVPASPPTQPAAVVFNAGTSAAPANWLVATSIANTTGLRAKFTA